MKKQIVTFEVFTELATLQSDKILEENGAHSTSLLIYFKDKLQEVIIIQLSDSIVIYSYTDNYLPLLELFESKGIAPKKYNMFVNTIDSSKHLQLFLNRAYKKQDAEGKLLYSIKQGYRAARNAGVLGPVLDEFIKEGVYGLREIRRETQLGKLSIEMVSRVIDDVIQKSSKPTQSNSFLGNIRDDSKQKSQLEKRDIMKFI